MTYTPDIPKSGESLGGTRQRINDNFLDINTWTGVNHYSLTAGSDIGKHSFLQMPNQGTIGSVTGDPVTLAGEAAFWTKLDGGTIPQFVIKNQEGSGTGEVYQLTKMDDTLFTKFGVETAIGSYFSGWTFLPGNLTVNYIRTTAPGAVLFAKQFASLIDIFYFNGTNISPSIISSLTNTGFTTSAIGTNYYIAIGI